MGEVYRAKDTKLGREVAIKLLLEEVSADPERLARFEREAKVLASLNHPHLVTIFSVEQVGDTRFFTMELVEGETLETVLSGGALSAQVSPAPLSPSKTECSAQAISFDLEVVA
jgi:serine/threonine protein kinase